VVVTETARPGKAGALGKVTNPSTAKRPNINCIATARVQPVDTAAKSGNAVASTPSVVAARADYAIAANSAVRRASIVCVSTVCSSATKMLASPEVEFIVPTKGDDARRRYICHRHA
jgi:hypothetical protein